MSTNKKADNRKASGEKKKEPDQVPQEEQEPLNPMTYTVPSRREFQHRLCILCDDTPTSKNGKGEKSDEDGDEAQAVVSGKEYIKCAMKNCRQNIHRECAENFKCSEYSPTNAKLLFNADGPICPAHFCCHCYDERKKNAARFGELIDCSECVRSFHLQCMPAGCKITSQSGKRKMFTCHFHSERKGPISERMRLSVCLECEEPFSAKGKKENGKDDGMRRMTCKNCSNVYHLKCAYVEVKGLKEKYENDLCSYCIYGSSIVPGQNVLAWSPANNGLPAGYYPGVAVAISELPLGVKSKLERCHLGKCGWIPIKWIWDGILAPFYNVVHRSLVHRMNLNSDKNLKNDDFKPEVLASMKNFRAPTFPLDYAAMRETISIVDHNVHTNELTADEKWEKPRVKKRDQEIDFECDCKPKMSNGILVKCNTDNCGNRADNRECPKTCDAEEVNGKPVVCMNRVLQKKEEKTLKYEVKLTDNGKGFGLFATDKIEQDEFIIEYCGEVINQEELERREKRISELRAFDEWTYLMGLTTKLTVDARFKGSLARYINHSCGPNSKVERIEVPAKYIGKNRIIFEPRLKVYALKTIQAGEEITFNYELRKTVGLALDKCRCGAKNCDGKIGKMTAKDDNANERYDGETEFAEDEDEDVSEGSNDEKENKKSPKGKAKATTKKAAIKRRGSSLSSASTSAPKEKKRK